MSEASKTSGRFFKKKLIIIGLIVIFLLTPPIYYFYSQYQKMYAEYKKTQILLGKSSASVNEEELNKEIVEKVSKLIELPDETPTIASITDKAKLQEQPFFARAQNGDKVLIFQNSKKAIIYRESANKIIEVGAISIGDSPIPTPTLLPAPSKAVLEVSPAVTIAPSPTP